MNVILAVPAAPPQSPSLDWARRAACRHADPDSLFASSPAQSRAKSICPSCPVKVECLAEALDARVEHGAWGGMTDRERRALLRRRPDVTSWLRLLETARDEWSARHAIPPANRRELATAGGTR